MVIRLDIPYPDLLQFPHTVKNIHYALGPGSSTDCDCKILHVTHNTEQQIVPVLYFDGTTPTYDIPVLHPPRNTVRSNTAQMRSVTPQIPVCTTRCIGVIEDGSSYRS